MKKLKKKNGCAFMNKKVPAGSICVGWCRQSNDEKDVAVK